MAKGKTDKRTKSAINEVVTRECTIHLNKRLHTIGFKKRSPRAVKIIRKFAEKEMGTKDVRIDTRLNKAIWSRGIRWVHYDIKYHLQKKLQHFLCLLLEIHLSVFVYVSHVAVMMMKIHQTSSTHWSPIFQLKVSKNFKQKMLKQKIKLNNFLNFHHILYCKFEYFNLQMMYRHLTSTKKICE